MPGCALSLKRETLPNALACRAQRHCVVVRIEVTWSLSRNALDLDVSNPEILKSRIHFLNSNLD